MGQLAGFSYREIVKRLKELGLKFHRQAAGSHEIWFNPALNRYTTIPRHSCRRSNTAWRRLRLSAPVTAASCLACRSPEFDTFRVPNA
ncbi:MAG: type II toxin-antitoxin system HicA family toxin [Candidatus Accumulibacter necessarius]|uniref:type II toxin-antitoxin system HicA family toxin n=1 Tax=Candidatus Accumulibacter necessarius TaxID=2954386 RepID=UPI002FC3A26F